MSEISAREPGLAAIALTEVNLLCEVIADGHHVSADILRFMYHLKGNRGICLVTDSIIAKQMPAGDYMLGQLPITVHDGEAVLKQGKSLAGSVATFDQCYRHFKHVNQLADQEMIYVSS